MDKRGHPNPCETRCYPWIVIAISLEPESVETSQIRVIGGLRFGNRIDHG